MIDCKQFGTPLAYKLLQFIGLIGNAYFLIHMVMLNIWFGKGITPITIWNQICYLSNIDHILIFVYHLWSVIIILKGVQRPSMLKKLYQFVFNLSFLAAFSYWSIRFVDQKLVHGKHSSAELGELYQLFIHGFNHFLLFLEIFIEDKEQQWRSSFLQFAPFIAIYTVQVSIQQFYFSRSVYPFQKLIAPYGFLLPLAIIPILMVIDKLYTQRVFNFLKFKVVDDREIRIKKID